MGVKVIKDKLKDLVDRFKTVHPPDMTGIEAMRKNMAASKEASRQIQKEKEQLSR